MINLLGHGLLNKSCTYSSEKTQNTKGQPTEEACLPATCAIHLVLPDTAWCVCRYAADYRSQSTGPTCSKQQHKHRQLTAGLSFLFESGDNILLILHSYAGCPGDTDAKGLSERELGAQGRTEGIIGLIFIARFLCHKGDLLFSRL